MRLVQGEKINGTKDLFIVRKMLVSAYATRIMSFLSGIGVASFVWSDDGSRFWWAGGALICLTLAITAGQTWDRTTRYLHQRHTRNNPKGE